MNKRKKLKKFWSEKVVPNRKKVASRVITAGAVYMLTGPTVALALNATAVTEVAKELANGYAGIADSCLGDKKLGFIPVPKSYLEGALCVAMILTCGAAAAQGWGNRLNDAACVGLVRSLAEQKPA